MTLERPLAWLAGLAVVAVVVLLGPAPPRPPDLTVVAALGVVVTLPLALVFLAWLYTFRSRSAGRVGARLRSFR